MKKIKILLIILSIGFGSSAQIWNPKNVAKRKAEDRVNQKVDSTIDKALDGLFAPKKNDKKSGDNTKTSSGEPDISGILGGLNMGGTPNSSYSFSSSLTMKMTMSNPKEKSNFTMRSKYMFSEDNTAMGIKFLESDNKDLAKSTAMMDAVIMDFGQQKIFTFMNNDGQKTMMGIGIKDDDLSKYVEKENDKINIEKTTQSKTIAGYKCTGYKINQTNEKSEVLMWVSNTRVGDFAKLASKMSQGGSPFGVKAKTPNYMSYNVHPEFVKMANEGRMVLGFTAKGDKGETSDMEYEEVKVNDKMTFNTSGYKSMFGN